jgi:hypothetical protein
MHLTASGALVTVKCRVVESDNGVKILYVRHEQGDNMYQNITRICWVDWSCHLYGALLFHFLWDPCIVICSTATQGEITISAVSLLAVVMSNDEINSVQCPDQFWSPPSPLYNGTLSPGVS